MHHYRRAINALLISLLSTANSFVAGNASQEKYPFSTASIVHTIGDEIICDEVTLSIILINREHPGDSLSIGTVTTTHVDSFACVVDPDYTYNGATKGIQLELMNLSPSFEEGRKKAIAIGKTRLVVRDGVIDGPTLVLPDNPEGYKEVEEAAISGGDEFHQTSFKPLLDWQFPPTADSVSARKTHSRNLATDQFGEKTVLVFRITANDVVPTKTAAEVSDGVFGTTGDEVTLTSQYSACSYGQLNFAAASGQELADLTDGHAGVINISVVTVNSSMLEAEINNAVIVKAQDTANDGLGLDLADYDHIMFHVPLGTEITANGGTGWVAFASKVRQKCLDRLFDCKVSIFVLVCRIDAHTAHPVLL